MRPVGHQCLGALLRVHRDRKNLYLIWEGELPWDCAALL